MMLEGSNSAEASPPWGGGVGIHLLSFGGWCRGWGVNFFFLFFVSFSYFSRWTVCLWPGLSYLRGSLGRICIHSRWDLEEHRLSLETQLLPMGLEKQPARICPSAFRFMHNSHGLPPLIIALLHNHCEESSSTSSPASPPLHSEDASKAPPVIAIISFRHLQPFSPQPLSFESAP